MKQRNPAMDIIRSVAFFCVVSVHFFLNSGFYDADVSGPLMFVMMVLRSFFMICVPLFLLLSGYLMRKKQPTLQYYLKLIYTLVIYVLASMCCMFYLNYIQGNRFSLFVAVIGTLSFDNAPYAWYVEMYIGLFLMIPFLNGMYNSLASQKQKQLLVLTFLFLTAIPSVVNIYRIGDPQWWAMPSISLEYKQLLPSWWTQLYPLTYYFIGCYLSEYPLRIKASSNALLIAFLTLFTGAFCYYRSYGSTFVTGAWEDYYSLFTTAISVSVFSFFQNLDYSRVSPAFCKLFQKISGLSFGAYLVSWIFDEHFYLLLNSHIPDIQNRFIWFPVIVPVIFLLSLALSAVLEGIYAVTVSPVLRLIDKKWLPQN